MSCARPECVSERPRPVHQPSATARGFHLSAAVILPRSAAGLVPAREPPRKRDTARILTSLDQFGVTGRPIPLENRPRRLPGTPFLCVILDHSAGAGRPATLVCRVWRMMSRSSAPAIGAAGARPARGARRFRAGAGERERRASARCGAGAASRPYKTGRFCTPASVPLARRPAYKRVSEALPPRSRRRRAVGPISGTITPPAPVAIGATSSCRSPCWSSRSRRPRCARAPGTCTSCAWRARRRCSSWRSAPRSRPGRSSHRRSCARS
jgi:hypothetical protein